MKIKIDENIPARLQPLLVQLGHHVLTVAEEGLTGYGDDDIWKIAQKENEFLITQDLDFSDTRKFIPGTHCGILLVRLHQPGRKALLQKIHYLFITEDVESWERCFVVLTDNKIRIRRPD